MGDQLDKRQIAWQNWRDRLYQEKRDAEKHLDALCRFSKDGRGIAEARECAKRLQQSYDRASRLDTAMKNARYDDSEGQPYIRALEACESFMAQTKF
jgi:DNA replication protein DnaC